MYVPPAFRAGDDEAAGFVAAHPLAQVVVHTNDGLVATPVPLVLRDGVLVGHVARPNAVWRHEGPTLAIFTGVDTYVSPSWYPSKAEHGRVVPTWNYETAQAHGTLVTHDDEAWTLDIVRLLTDVFESRRSSPWSVDDAPSDYIDGLLSAIVGIEIVDLHWTMKRKLSQNRGEAERGAVETSLAAGDPRQQAVADAMRRTRH